MRPVAYEDPEASNKPATGGIGHVGTLTADGQYAPYQITDYGTVKDSGA